MDYPRYDPKSPVTPLTEAEIQALDQLLLALPADGTMTLDGLDGYLTALLVGPPTLLADRPTEDWLPPVWGGDGPRGMAEATPFASMRQRKNTVVMVLRHLRHLSQQLNEAPAAWEPIFSVAEDSNEERVDARDWCAGFLQAVDLQPEAWGEVWADAALVPLLTLGGGLEGSAVEPLSPAVEAGEDLAQLDALSRAVPDLVLALLARRRAADADTDTDTE